MGYRLTFGAAEVVIYNTQGVLMQLLDPQYSELFQIDDDPDQVEDENDGGSPSASRSFELTYDRHEFLTYLDAHDTNPDRVLDPADPSWHVDGTRHIEHFQLVVAIHGLVDAASLPGPGATPSFTFRVKTKPSKGGGDEHEVLQRRIEATAGGPLTPLALACSALPATPCGQTTEPGASTLTIKQHDNPVRDQLWWLWTHGEGKSPRDFGELRRRHSVAFCRYDESGATPRLLLQAGARGGGKCRLGRGKKNCWRSSGNPPGENGFRYGNSDPAPSGVAKLVLARSGKRNSSIALKTMGDRVTIPDLPLGLPLRAQLQSTNGKCWEATYTGNVKTNGRDTFRARSD